MTGVQTCALPILKALAEAYQHRLFANEVMLLPYYVASLNIEHAYYERMKQYEAFPGLCFVDTLDMAEAQQIGLFTAANTERVAREKEAAITVIIGNPPYNVGQKSENDNNKNRKHKVVDGRVRDTYAKDSAATNKNSLSDMYVKFFRWAADRLKGRDGIVCFVSNNSFVDQIAFDGMRKHFLQDFERIDHIDLHGNVRRNPQLSGTTHNVFGIQVGVGITLAIKKKGAARQLRYHRVPEMWRKAEKLEFVAKGEIPWQTLTPDAEHAGWCWSTQTNTAGSPRSRISSVCTVAAFKRQGMASSMTGIVTSSASALRALSLATTQRYIGIKLSQKPTGRFTSSGARALS